MHAMGMQSNVQPEYYNEEMLRMMCMYEDRGKVYLSASMGHCLLKAMSLRQSAGALLRNTAISLSATDCSACFSWLRLPSMLLKSLPLVDACADCLAAEVWLSGELPFVAGSSSCELGRTAYLSLLAAHLSASFFEYCNLVRGR